MRRITTFGAVACAVLAGGAASAAADTVQVTNAKNAAPGSFRAAVAAANGDRSVDRIVFKPKLKKIKLATPVVYSGGQDLEIVANGGILDGTRLASGAAAAFLANGGGDLAVSGLTVRDSPQEGLEYQVPSGSTGTKNVSLVGIKILGNDGHGVLINDQDFPEEAGDPDAEPPVPPTMDGSDASLEVQLIGSQIGTNTAGNGFGALDRDGVRINEGGLGDLHAVISLTTVSSNGGDGIELDERGDGDAKFDVTGSVVTRNGNFDLTIDPDDGMDVDEAGPGSVIGNVLASKADDNFEEGWDINENDAGDFLVDMTMVSASRNREEGIDLEEDDDFAGGGNLVTVLTGIATDGNVAGDGGTKIREKGLGDLSATLSLLHANGNGADGVNVREDADGALNATLGQATAGANVGDGVEFEENSTGTLTATVDHSNADANGQDGVEFDENGAGNLAGTVSNGSASGNTSAGVRADQQASARDLGTLALIAATVTGNLGGDIAAVNTTVTTTP